MNINNNHFIYYFRNIKSITSYRKKKFFEILLSYSTQKIKFVDIGAGFNSVREWQLIPSQFIETFSFEARDGNKPLAISNTVGETEFFVSSALNNSSLHKHSEDFNRRFTRKPETITSITVTTDTLDNLLKVSPDVLDINVEGHDYYVLEGARDHIRNGMIKCIKTEFDLFNVWDGQKWFSDIDKFMRSNDYVLARIHIDNALPNSAKDIFPVFHMGEPIEGKAVFVPSINLWKDKMKKATLNQPDDLIKAVVFYISLDIPGRAIDLLQEFDFCLPMKNPRIIEEIKKIYRFSYVDKLVFNLKISLKNKLR